MSDYVHVDVSNDFSTAQANWVMGFWIASVLLITTWDGLWKVTCFRRIRVGWVALVCALAMVWLRYTLHEEDEEEENQANGEMMYTYESRSNSAPPFVLRRALVVEPLLFLLAMSIVRVCLETQGTFARKLREEWFFAPLEAAATKSDENNNPADAAATPRSRVGSILVLLRTFGWSVVTGHLATPPELVALQVLIPDYHHDEPQQQPPVTSRQKKSAVASPSPLLWLAKPWRRLQHLTATLGTLLGATMVSTGTLHSLYIVHVAYDDISWLEFAANLCLPTLLVIGKVACVLVVLAVHVLYCGCCAERRRARRSVQFSKVHTTALEADIQDVTAVASEEDEDEDNTSHSTQEEDSPQEAEATGDVLATQASEDASEPASEENSATEEGQQAHGNLKSAIEKDVEAALFAGKAAQSYSEENNSILAETDQALQNSVAARETLEATLFSSQIFQVFVIVLFVLALLGYIVQLAPTLVAFWIATILALSTHYFVHHHHHPSNRDLILSRIDWDPLLVYVALVLVTASFADTGVPQKVFYQVLSFHSNRACPDDLVSCGFYFPTICFALAFWVSPVVAACLLGAYAPYATPFEWLLVSFALSAAHAVRQVLRWGTRTLVQGMNKDSDSRKARFGFVAVLTLVVLTLVGAFLLGVQVLFWYHWAPECSERLGEC